MLSFSNLPLSTLRIFSCKKIFIFSLLSVSLSACSEFFGYQPPASIYGQTERTDPYAENKMIPAQSSVENSKYQDIQILDNSQQKQPKIINGNVIRDALVARKTLSPAVVALISEADRNSKAGEFESAVATIERALRIDARNPFLTYKLAALRLKQSKPRLAEDLAKKAALLSKNDRRLKKQCWLLISEARRLQNNLYGAKEARLKADSL